MTGAFPLRSGRRGSNSRPQPWQGCALPTELRPPARRRSARCENHYSQPRGVLVPSGGRRERNVATDTDQFPRTFPISSWTRKIMQAGKAEGPGRDDRGLLSLSGRRGSNSRPQPWQGCALPTELRPHASVRLSPSGATATLPDPEDWSRLSERVTGIAHCASPLERGRSTTELHPRDSSGPGLSASPLGVLQTLADQGGYSASPLPAGAAGRHRTQLLAASNAS